MTLLPYEPAFPAEGKRYKVGPHCSVWNCGKLVDHAHHVWRRSYLKGDYWWVRVQGSADMVVTKNVIGLCWKHHEDVTGSVGGHRAKIIWVPETETLEWWLLERVGETNVKTWLPWGAIDTETTSYQPEPIERCPTCGRRMPQPRRAKLPKRKKTRIVITVPQDAQEDGAALLTQAIDDAAERLGRTENEEYYTLMDALNLFNLGNVE